MKRFFLIATIAALVAVSCTDPVDDKASLEVSPTSLAFEAVGSAPQALTITAKGGVTWELKISEEATWLTTTTTTGGKLAVSVTDNSGDPRSGTITVSPVNNTTVKAVQVVVTQQGGGDAADYSMTLAPVSLSFDPVGAAPQEVTVTAVGEGMTWTAVPEANASWITAEISGNKIIVTVADNPLTVQRAGNLIVTPSVSSVSPKAIRVMQAPKVLPPSLAVYPAEGFKFSASTPETKSLSIEAVNVEWGIKTLDEFDVKIDWIKTEVFREDGMSRVYVTVDENIDSEQRVGYVVVTSNVETVKDVRVKIVQAGNGETVSTIPGDVALTNINSVHAQVYPNQASDAVEKPAVWEMRMFTGNLAYDANTGDYTGSGELISLRVFSEHMLYNDAKEYSLVAGDYVVVAPVADMDLIEKMTMEAGELGYDRWQYFGGWYVKAEAGIPTVHAPFTSGKMNVKKSGANYTLTLSFFDDAMHEITGSYTGVFEVQQVGEPMD